MHWYSVWGREPWWKYSFCSSFLTKRVFLKWIFLVDEERPVLVWHGFMMKYFSVPLGMGVVAFLFIACCYLETLWTILHRDVTSISHKTGYLSSCWRWGSNGQAKKGQVKKGLCLWSVLFNKTCRKPPTLSHLSVLRLIFIWNQIHLCGMNMGPGVSLDVWNQTFSYIPKFSDSLLFLQVALS